MSESHSMKSKRLKHDLLRGLLAMGVALAAIGAMKVMHDADLSAMRPDAEHIRSIDAAISHGSTLEYAAVHRGFTIVHSSQLPHLYQTARCVARQADKVGSLEVVEAYRVSRVILAANDNSFNSVLVNIYFAPKAAIHDPRVLSWLLAIAKEENSDDAFYKRCLDELPTLRLPTAHEKEMHQTLRTCWESRRNILDAK